MYLITTATYTANRVVNDLIITPTTSTPVHVTITLNGCSASHVVIDENIGILPKSYPLFGGSYSDGVYTISAKDDEDIITVYNYGRLLNNILKDSKRLLCNKCKGEDCGDCNTEGKKCIKYQNLYNNLISYLNLERPFVLNNNVRFSTEIHIFLQKAVALYTCYIQEQLCKVDIKKRISGEITYTEELFKFYISLYYLALYYYFKYSMSALTSENITTLDNYFSYPTMKKCLSCVLDIDDLEDLYTGEVAHTDFSAFFSISPSIGERGLPEAVLITYSIESNDDTITSVTITNIGNVTGNVNQGTFDVITSASVSINFVMTINFIREGIAMTQNIVREYEAFTPQWVGSKGEPDLTVYDYDTLNIAIERVVQESTAISRDLVNIASYVWFVSTNPNAAIKNNGFNVTIGEWTDLTTFMIKKNHILTLADGVTTANLTYYRTRELLTTSEQNYSIE